MSGEGSDPKPRRKHTSSSHRTSQVKSSSKRHDKADDEFATPRPPSTLDELRRSRLEYFSKPAEQRRKNMKYVYDQPISSKSRVIKPESKEKRGAVSSSKSKEGSSSKKKKKRPRAHDKHADGDEDQVYLVRPEPKTEAKPRRSSPVPPEGSVVDKATVTRPQSSKATVNRKPPQRRHTAPAQVVEVDEDRPSTIIDEALPAPGRSSTVKVDPGARRPSLKRSSTSATAKTNVGLPKSSPSARNEKKAPSVLSAFFQAKPAPPEKKVACLTCGDDEVPISHSAKLPCKHRMCHGCLKRVFKLSITDPAHMPPRCCTEDHIDLKHVDRLFSQDFKRTWNRKFTEYKTKNRIYCAGKNCGEWIKPSHITNEHGRKIGKCKRCGTKVCAICNNKAHTSRDCPQDPATKQFIDTAKEKGWQKCFNCSAMVELKEGCNHMTCRCMAEFCMVCGMKWKSCDCPWFNYEAVDTHLGNPQRHQEELERRRDQEYRDEVLARRMEVLGVDEEDGAPGLFGIGNAAGHHMNANFIQQAREALTANYQNAEQAARGLLNGWYTGRENRMPDIPEDLNDLPRILRRASQRQRPRDEAEDDASPERRRRNTHRRRNQPVDIPPAFENGRYQPTEEDREQERRIREWATGLAE